MSDVYLAALDQRTGFSRYVIYDQALRPVASAQKPVTILCHQPGWREYAPQELLASLQSALYEALYQSGLRPAQIGAVGLANQRETAVVWEKATGRPIYNAISWQCRRTKELCRRLAGDEDFARPSVLGRALPLPWVGRAGSSPRRSVSGAAPPGHISLYGLRRRSFHPAFFGGAAGRKAFL